MEFKMLSDPDTLGFVTILVPFFAFLFAIVWENHEIAWTLLDFGHLKNIFC